MGIKDTSVHYDHLNDRHVGANARSDMTVADAIACRQVAERQINEALQKFQTFTSLKVSNLEFVNGVVKITVEL